MRSSTVTADEIEVRETLARLFAARAAGATVCPSEVARALADAGDDTGEGDWREKMPRVHAAIDALLDAGLVTLRLEGQPARETHWPVQDSAAETL